MFGSFYQGLMFWLTVIYAVAVVVGFTIGVVFYH